MITRITVCLLFAATLVAAGDAEKTKKKGDTMKVNANDIGASATVIGTLGEALGAIIQIKGVFLDGDELRSKADEGKSFLDVQAVNGKTLVKAVRIELRTFSWLDVKLDQLTHKEVLAFKGYESGGFQGIPSEAFKVMPAVATTDHHFRTWFQICAAGD